MPDPAAAAGLLRRRSRCNAPRPSCCLAGTLSGGISPVIALSKAPRAQPEAAAIDFLTPATPSVRGLELINVTLYKVQRLRARENLLITTGPDRASWSRGRRCNALQPRAAASAPRRTTGSARVAKGGDVRPIRRSENGRARAWRLQRRYCSGAGPRGGDPRRRADRGAAIPVMRGGALIDQRAITAATAIPTPRSGGIGIIAAAFLACVVLPWPGVAPDRRTGMVRRLALGLLAVAGAGAGTTTARAAGAAQARRTSSRRRSASQPTDRRSWPVRGCRRSDPAVPAALRAVDWSCWPSCGRSICTTSWTASTACWRRRRPSCLRRWRGCR